MTEWSESYLADFDPADTDEAKIKRTIWVPCRICWRLFERLRLTARYCHQCHEGFCEGEHGRFDERLGRFFCARHHPRSLLQA